MSDVHLKFCNSLMEAQMVKSFLTAHGIQCVLQKRGLEWSEGAGGDTAGADLLVSQKDLPKAKELLDF